MGSWVWVLQIKRGNSARSKIKKKRKKETASKQKYFGFADWSKVDGLLFCSWRPQAKFYQLVICQCHVGTNILEGWQKHSMVTTSTIYCKAHLPFNFYGKTRERIQIGGRFNFLKIAPNWLPVILCRPKVCEISSLTDLPLTWLDGMDGNFKSISV